MKIRKADLSFLTRYYEQEGSQLLALYGYGGTGMSKTIAEFMKGKPHLYYYAAPASVDAQKQMLAGIVERKYHTTVPGNSFEAIFSAIPENAGEKLVVVVEEFQHLARKDGEFLQSIGKMLEAARPPAAVFLVLASTDVVWMKQEFFSEQMPLKKQITDVYCFQEWGFVDVAQEFVDYPVDELIRLYGVFGGCFSYLQLIDRNVSVKENIIRLILTDTGALYGEAQHFLKNNLREVSVYNTILSAIAGGNEKLNDLFHVTGFSRAKISVYMKNLGAFGVVEKVHSIETGGWENAKKGIYRIENTFLDFWFRFVYPHLSDLHESTPEDFYAEYIKPGFDLYMERYFTKVCAEYLQLMSRIHKLPIQIRYIGTWIGKKGTIDIVAQNEARERIVAKCCWQKPEMSAEDLRSLTEATKEAKIKAGYYYLFTAGKFQSDLKEFSKAQYKLELVDLDCF